ncbi:unnamed protein product [Nezara viridula]|uniref:Ion transport domain-containing protein n=1 Tax=Nezara viridula TaxID=85310 RepID=A0A9P0EEC3_NEZVI|nr:unnamed protein product [Nezara viridula]
MIQQVVEVAKLGAMFPFYTVIYMIAPTSRTGMFMKKPFVKFICHSASYSFFLMLLGMASQRVETLVIEMFGPDWMVEFVQEWKRPERGSMPGVVESFIIVYVISLIWNEARALWSDGLLDYVNDLWNIVDFITNMFYCTWICMRATAWFIVQREIWTGQNYDYAREQWDMFDPMLISEGAFAAGMIFSFLKLVHIFSVNPHLGPLQISLGRMIIDIIKFFFIYTLVLFAFGCGLNQLMWYYADLEKSKCYHNVDGPADFDTQERACSIWRRFANLFETSQSLFWASFGLVDLTNFELTGIKGFTRFWALLMFGSYSVINIIVLLNMLIAMMSNSYQIISERSDVEWKFARSKLWVSYFEEGDTIPPPFNLLPSAMVFINLFRCGDASKRTDSMVKKSRTQAQNKYEAVMRLLVRRYVTAEQRKRDEVGITEDDVMEIRQDISTLRFELIDILHNNGMKTPKIDPKDSTVPGKKGRVMERRLLKDFQIGFVEGIINEALQTDKEPKDVFSKIARAIGRRSSSQKSKKDWNALVRKGTLKRDPIGSASEAIARKSRQSARKYIIENQSSSLTTIDTEKLLEYNPNLSLVSPAARIAYTKFKLTKIKNEYSKREAAGSETCSENTFEMSDPVEEDGNMIQPPIPEKKEMSKQDQSTTQSFRARTPIAEDPREDLMTPVEDDKTLSAGEVTCSEGFIKDSFETVTPEETSPPSPPPPPKKQPPKPGTWF